MFVFIAVFLGLVVVVLLLLVGDHPWAGGDHPRNGG